MQEKLTAKIFDFYITTKCTMNCKLCAVAVPYNPNPCHTPKDVAFREIAEFFKVWDFAERVEFIGGEPLMHPEILEIVKETLKYRDQFGGLRITTNATIVPGNELLELARDCGKFFDFIVDDYGQLSKNLDRIVEKLEHYCIPYRVDVYHGENQRYDGWIHFGDYTDYNYSDEEAEGVFHNCIAPKNMFVCVNNGKMFPCVYAMSLFFVNGLFLSEEYVDLFDYSIPITRKREIAAEFCRNLLTACRYCKGFDSEKGKRYPAGEQICKSFGNMEE